MKQHHNTWYKALSSMFICSLLSCSAWAGDPATMDVSQGIHPQLKPAIMPMLAAPAFPPISKATLPMMRERRFNEGALLADVAVEKQSVPVAADAPNVSVYVINAGKPGTRPAILHTHGGGYISGSAADSVLNLQQLAKELDCVIVSVDYRLAPETTYKGSIEDNYAGLRWLHNNAQALGVDPDRIAVMGESAGGGHAALLAITARDRKEVPVLFQVLIYPMLDDRTASTKAVPEHIGKILWNRQANQFGWEAFLGQKPGTQHVPAAAVPARTADLAGLPPAFIGVGAIDLFVDEDIEYAQRLINAGVATELLVVPGAYHAFDMIAKGTPVADDFTAAKIQALKRAFNNGL